MVIPYGPLTFNSDVEGELITYRVALTDVERDVVRAIVREELEAALCDAARYRWLRENHHSNILPLTWKRAVEMGEDVTADLDRAIDWNIENGGGK